MEVLTKDRQGNNMLVWQVEVVELNGGKHSRHNWAHLVDTT
jgi:hypothetical protein